MLWKAGCLLTGVWSGQLGPHACPLCPAEIPIWLGCSGVGWADSVGPLPTGLTSSPGFLCLSSHGVCSWQACSELPRCPSGLEGWLCPWYTSARVHSQMTIQGAWLEIYSSPPTSKGLHSQSGETLTEWYTLGFHRKSLKAPVFFYGMRQTLWSSWQHVLKFKL